MWSLIPVDGHCSDILRYLGDPKKNVLQSGVTRSIAKKTGHLVNFCSFVPLDYCNRIHRIWRIASSANVSEQSQILYVLYHEGASVERITRWPEMLTKLHDLFRMSRFSRVNPRMCGEAWMTKATGWILHTNWTCTAYKNLRETCRKIPEIPCHTKDKNQCQIDLAISSKTEWHFTNTK